MSDYLKDEMFEEILDLDDGEKASESYEEPCEEASEESCEEPIKNTPARGYREVPQRMQNRRPGAVSGKGQPGKSVQSRVSVLEEDDEEEQSPVTILITFSALVIIAAIICGVLWIATHQGKGEDVQSTYTSKQDKNGDDKEHPVSQDELNKDIQNEQPDLPVSDDPNVIITSDNKTIEFLQCDYMVTPKAYVNLRLEPSTSQGEKTVKIQVENGEQLHCTGYNNEYGWSRVEYNGDILYVVSSYVLEVK